MEVADTTARAGEAARAPSASPGERYREIRRVTLVGSLVDLVLGIVKLAVGWLAQSQALIADGIHSLSDLATDGMVLLAAKHAHQEADDEHPYGHARIETAATVALGGALIVVGIGIAWDSVRRLFEPALLLEPGPWALVVAAGAVVLKEGIYHYTMRYARRLRSSLLEANAWHSRTDAISSIVVMAGVGGAMAGLWYVDAVAAVIVAVMVGKIGWDLAWSSVRELIDTGLDAEVVEQIRETILSVDGVQALHLLRTRRMGSRALVDVHILLAEPRLSVSEGHQISETVRGRLIHAIEDVEDVTVHIDPEDDEESAPNRYLPLRAGIMKKLNACWSELEAARSIKDVTLHYLDGKIHVDLLLPLALAPTEADARALGEAFARAAGDVDEVAEVRLHFG